MAPIYQRIAARAGRAEVHVTCHNFILINWIEWPGKFIFISKTSFPNKILNILEIFPWQIWLVLNLSWISKLRNNDGISLYNGDTNWATPWIPSPALLTILSPSSVTLSHISSLRLIWPCHYCLTIHLKCCVNYCHS